MESNDVRALGICGMGGIGKTTIAKAFYNKYAHEFDISCFM
ncbi:NB-ARC domain-containing protein [Klebsiella pneumoniae]